MSNLLPDAWSTRFANGVGWYAKRLIGRKFFAMRMLRGNVAAMEQLACEQKPSMIIMNHCSWWDPMTMLALRHMYFKRRSNVSPMDKVALERFRFMRKCGMFGIDPDDANSLTLMTDYVRKRFEQLPLCTISLTPQGRFVDVRDQVRPRPGAATILARNPSMRVWRISCEYNFWQDQRPEIFLSVAEVSAPETRTTSGWQRCLSEVMESQQRLLEQAVRSRNPELFDSILGDHANKIHPIYDFWLRLRGKSTALQTQHRITSQYQDDSMYATRNVER